MIVREIVPSDIPSVAAAHSAAWRAAFHGILSDSLLTDFGGVSLEQVWAEIILRPNRLNLVAVHSGRTIGFVGFQSVPSEAKKSEVIGIYVHPEYWRLGAGKALLSAATNRMAASGAHEAFLWTMRENLISRRFYQKEGFMCTQDSRVSVRQGESFTEVKYRKEI